MIWYGCKVRCVLPIHVSAHNDAPTVTATAGLHVAASGLGTAIHSPKGMHISAPRHRQAGNGITASCPTPRAHDFLPKVPPPAWPSQNHQHPSPENHQGASLCSWSEQPCSTHTPALIFSVLIPWALLPKLRRGPPLCWAVARRREEQLGEESQACPAQGRHAEHSLQGKGHLCCMHATGFGGGMAWRGGEYARVGEGGKWPSAVQWLRSRAGSPPCACTTVPAVRDPWG